MSEDRSSKNRRAYMYWRTLAATLGDDEHRRQMDDEVATDVVKGAGLPPLLLDPRPSIDDVLKRHPELAPELHDLMPPEDERISEASVRRAALFGKVVQNVFGGNRSGTVSAQEYSDWMQDVGHMERMFGAKPGSLRAGGSSRGSAPMGGGVGKDTTATGVAEEVSKDEIEFALSEIAEGRGLMSEPELKASLESMEKNLIDRMALREVLKDKELAAKLTPSMALVEQLLRDKNNLEGVALKNAKSIVRRYIDSLADFLKREVASTPSGKVDDKVPPKRVFRNLDLDRTIWKNLINYDPESERLFVDKLYYHRRSKRTNNTRLIIVVDQSGSMVEAMVNCTILASIFAGLPKVDAHLIAFDTEVLNLTPWVHDPMEVLLRTNLGGGNDGPKAMVVAEGAVVDPRNTVMVWISDFYEFQNDKPLMAMIRRVIASGITFIPVGSVSSRGYFNLNPYFRAEFKKDGIPLISGSLKTLIRELKTSLPG